LGHFWLSKSAKAFSIGVILAELWSSTVLDIVLDMACAKCGRAPSVADSYLINHTINTISDSIWMQLLLLREACCHPHMVENTVKHSVPETKLCLTESKAFGTQLTRVQKRKQPSIKNVIKEAEALQRISSKIKTSAKIKKTIEILKSIRNGEQREKTIIFSQFTSLLKLLAVAMDEKTWWYEQYDGKMSLR